MGRVSISNCKLQIDVRLPSAGRECGVRNVESEKIEGATRGGGDLSRAEGTRQKAEG